MYQVGNSVEQVFGGSVIKQGDRTPLGFNFRDENGELVNLTGSTVQVKMASNKGVVVEKQAVISDEYTVTFSLGEEDITGAGDMRVEFIVIYPSGLQEKFPSDDWQRIRITSTLEDVEKYGVGYITFEQMKADIDKKYIGFQNQLDSIVHDAGDSNPEIVQARVDKDGNVYTTLKKRIDAERDKIEQKADQSYVETMLATAVSGAPKGFYNTLTALQTAYPQGTDGVFLVLENGHIYIWNGTTWGDAGVYQGIQVADGSVNNVALSLSGIDVPVVLKYSPKQMWSGGTSPGRVYSTTLYNFKIGDKISLSSDAIIQYALYDSTGATPLLSGWQSSSYTFTQNISMYVGLKKIDGSVINSTEIPILSKMLYVTDEKTIVNYDRNIELIKKVTGIVDGYVRNANVDFTGIKLPKTIPFSKKKFWEDGLVNNRLYSLSSYDFKAGDRLTVSSGYDLSLYNPNATTYLGWTSGTYVIPLDVTLYVGLRKTGDAVIANDEIDKIGNSFVISNGLTAATFNDVKLLSNKSKTLYVSPNGSDSNDGETEGKPLATIQKAIDMGASVILAERKPFYNQTFSLTDGRPFVLKPYGSDSFALDKPNRAKISFRNGTFFTGTLVNGLYTFSYSGSTRFNQVFKDKTLPPLTTGSRPSYNAGLWQNHLDWTLDDRLKPVLTMDEVIAERGTFTWDGSVVTVNPFNNSMNPTGFTAHGNIGTTVTLRNCEKVRMEDVDVEYSLDRNMSIVNCKDVELQNVTDRYTMFADGIQLDNSNGVFRRCESHKARNDGFNLHGYGDTHFYDCEGHYNGDDGISHHDGCTGSINGSYFSHNGKSGIAPTYGAKINLFNNLCTDQPYNYYCVSTSDYSKRTVRHFGNRSLRASTADIIASNYDIIGNNNNYTIKSLSSGGTYTEV